MPSRSGTGRNKKKVLPSDVEPIALPAGLVAVGRRRPGVVRRATLLGSAVELRRFVAGRGSSWRPNGRPVFPTPRLSRAGP